MRYRDISNRHPIAARSLWLIFLFANSIAAFVNTAPAQQFTRTRSATWLNVSGHNIVIHPQTGEILVAARDPQETAIVRTYSPDLSTSSERTFGQSSGIAVSISSSGKFINIITMPSNSLNFTYSLFAGKLSSEKPLAKRDIRKPEFPLSGLSLGDRDDAPTIMILNFETKTISTENLLTRQKTSTELIDDLQLLRFPISQAISPNFSFFSVARTGPTWTDPGFDLYNLPALMKIDLDTQPLQNVSAVNFAQPNNTLLVGDETGQIAVWDLQKTEPRRICLIQPSKLLAKHTVRELALSKNGRYLAGRLDNSIEIWSLPDGKYLTTLDRQGRDWISFAWRDETLITLANESEKPESKNAHVEFWSIADRKKTSSIDPHTRRKRRHPTMSPSMQKNAVLLMAALMTLNGILYFSWPAFRNFRMKDPRIVQCYEDLERQFGFKTQNLNPWFIGLFAITGIAILIAMLLF